MLWKLIPTKQMPKIKSNDQTIDNLRNGYVPKDIWNIKA